MKKTVAERYHQNIKMQIKHKNLDMIQPNHTGKTASVDRVIKSRSRKSWQLQDSAFADNTYLIFLRQSAAFKGV